MRILFLNPIFPGQFRALALALGAQAGNTVLFLAESGARAPLPGVRRLRLAPPAPCDAQDPVEREALHLLRRGARAGNAMLTLRRDGFAPDLVIASAGMGGSVYVRDVFPRAFYVAYADWFRTRAGDSPRPATDFAQDRMRNLWQYNALGDCDMAVTFSHWQRAQYPECLRSRIQVTRNGINTRRFSPAPNGRRHPGELVTFYAPPGDPARGFAQFAHCLPHLLALRPDCLAALAWPGGHSRAAMAPAPDDLAAWRALGLPDMEPPLRRRVLVPGPCAPDAYRDMLRQSTVHVYLAAPHVFSTGLLEALSCGALVVASDVPQVREVVQDGVNGVLCGMDDAETLARSVARTLERAPDLDAMRREARRTVERDYEGGAQTDSLLRLISDGMRRRKAGEARHPSPSASGQGR